MTEGSARSVSEVGEVLRLLLRRAGHELRNAQNAAAVNLEVIRSRVAAGRTDQRSLEPFSENAAAGLEDSAQLAAELLSLCRAVTSGLASGKVVWRDRTAGHAVVELLMPEESARQLSAGLAMLSERARFGVEATGAGVILRIPPDIETT